MTEPISKGETVLYEPGTTPDGTPLTRGYNSVTGELVGVWIKGIKQLPREPTGNYPIQHYPDGRLVLTDAERRQLLLQQQQQQTKSKLNQSVNSNI